MIFAHQSQSIISRYSINFQMFIRNSHKARFWKAETVSFAIIDLGKDQRAIVVTAVFIATDFLVLANGGTLSIICPINQFE